MEQETKTQRHTVRQRSVLAWMRLARVFQKIDTLSERFFRSYGLNTAQFDILAQVGSHTEMTQQELADALLVTKGNISQLLGKLEQECLVQRRQDGRTNYVSLTEEGRALFREVVPQQEIAIAELLKPLSSDEQRQLLQLLRRLDHGIFLS